MQTINPYENQHRLLKAVRMVDALEEIGIPLATAKQFTQAQKLSIATHIESGPPSDGTWNIVCDLYEKRVSAPFQ